MRTLFLTILILLTVFAGAAHAHRVNVFAWVEGETVHGEASFSGGKPAMNSEIAVVREPGGEEILTTTTDESGKFSFDIPKAVVQGGGDLKIMLKAGMGHQDAWTVKAAEYGGSSAIEEEQAPSEQAGGESAATVDNARLEELTASIKALEHRVAEISEAMARQTDSGPGLTEIIGGIGYILGLIGVAAYMRSRRG